VHTQSKYQKIKNRIAVFFFEKKTNEVCRIANANGTDKLVATNLY